MASGDQCSGLGSFLAMSCRGRAEAFARKLHTKLKSLGSHDDNGLADESSWLAAHENPITISQPAHSTNSEAFLEVEVLESPGSPTEELEEVDYNKLMNKDTLQPSRTKNQVDTFLSANSVDSDSDLPFYDTEDQRIVHETHTNGIDISSEEDSDTFQNSVDSSSECTSQQAVSLSEDVSSMLSFKEEDVIPLENEEPLLDFSKCNGIMCEDIGARILVSNEVSESKSDCLKSYEKKSTKLKEENDEEDDDSEKIPRVRRSTSLKTGKTPPGTPSCKKIVRFADALGLDLADVRTFLDDIPKIPNSAFEDLLNADLSDSLDSTLIERAKLKPNKYLMPLFQQPASLPNFLDKVREYNVCMENVFVDDPFLLSLKGTVRVRNLDFHKSVHVRYSLDSWKTFADVQATYVENSCDGFSDKFSFLLYAHTLSIGMKLELACRFQCRGFQYWDNNNGINYCFQCLPPTGNRSETIDQRPHDDWGGASFY